MDQQLQDRLRGELEVYGADAYSDEVKDLKIGNDGFADSAQATEERSELLGQIDVARTRVRQIDGALQRMTEGEYGTCEVCGEPIQEARLEVRPLSTQCVDCASSS